MKKKILIGILSMSVLSIIIGCSDNKENANTAINNSIVEEVVDGEEDEGEELEDTLDELLERNQELAGYTIITPYVQIILTNNGKVLAKGENMYGQLGNGERTNTETWSEIEGLENVVGIYSLGNVGAEMHDEYAYAHVYALTSSGELYRWGGNILTPEKVTMFSTIKEVKSTSEQSASTDSSILVICESGEKYIIRSRFNLNGDDSVYSYNSLPDDAELYECCGGYLIYSDNQLSYIDVQSFNQGTDSFDEIVALEDRIVETLPGNGTVTEYFDGCIDIDEARFSDFIYNSSRKYYVALDGEYNIWGWGKGFGEKPEIIVKNTDFIVAE